MKSKYLFVVLLLSSALVKGQSHFDHYSVENGLSQNSVMSIVQDHRGYLWFGTEDGLNRFDGYSFKTFFADPEDSLVLSSDQVWTLTEDQEGRIWIGHNEGISYFDTKSYQFHNILVDEGLSISSAYKDSAGDLWFGSAGGGLVNIDVVDLTITKYYNDNPTPTQFDATTWEVAANYVTSIIEYEDGLWIGTRGSGFWKFSNGKFSRLRVKHPNQKFLDLNVVWSMIKDEDGNLYMGTMLGLASFYKATKTLKIYPQAAPPNGPGFAPLTTLHFNKGGNGLWIGSYGEGLFFYDLSNNAFTNYSHDKGDANSISSNLVYAMYEDRSDNLWIGTWGGGLNKLSKRARLFNKYGTKDGFDNEFITGIANNNNKEILVATYTGGIYRGIKSKTNDKYLFTKLEASSGLKLNFINTIHLGERSIYAGLDGAGVAILDKANPSADWKYYGKILENPNSLNHQLIGTLLEDDHRTLWVGTRGGGLKRVYLDKPYGTPGSIQNFDASPDNIYSLQGHRISTVHIDKKEYLWVGTESGLSRSRNPIAKDSVPNEFINFGGRAVTAIAEQNEKLWVGTNHGLYSLDGELLVPESRMGNNVINAIVIDDSGSLWVTTNNGLYCIKKDQSISRFTSGDGLQSNEFNTHSGLKLGSDIIIGGIHGLNSFNPSTIANVDFPGVVAVTKVTIDKNRIINDPHYVELGASDKVIEFEFTSFDFANTLFDEYEYRLIGFDPQWTSNSSSRVATYTNLDAGDYVFEVRKKDSGSIENIYAVDLNVVPPFWRTWWAYSSYAIIIIIAVFVARRNIVNRERLKAKLELEHLQLTKLKELDDFKSKFFANVSHEFRTPLTLIMGQTDELIRKENVKDISTLQSIRQNSHSALNLVNQLLDLSKIDAGKVSLQLYRVKILEFLKQHIDMFHSLAENKKIELTISYPDEERVVCFDPDILEKIIVNLLSNAIKYSRSGDSVKVIAEIKNSVLHIEVIDTGIGISAEDVPKIFDRFFRASEEVEGTGIGLSLTKELVTLHKGTIKVKSKLGVGTQFTVEIPVDEKVYEVDYPIHEFESTEISASTMNGFPQEVGQEEAPNEGAPLLLIVEDNEELRNYLVRNLESSYSVLLAGNGDDGLIKGNLAVPDIILSDWMMPGLSGIELCKKIKSAELTSHIPVVLLTAKADMDAKLQGLELGADDYITKPFDLLELKARLHNLVDQRKKLREKFSQLRWNNQKPIKVLSLDEQFLSKVHAIIEENLSNPQLNVEWLSREIGVSRVQLHRKLSALIGHSASELIKDCKLTRAAELLKQNAGNVSEVAYQVGFENLSYFTKVFKQKYSVNPSEFV